MRSVNIATIKQPILHILALLSFYSRTKQLVQPERFKDPARVDCSVLPLQGKDIVHPLAH